MALNLSTLTNSATSASILNEALTTADLLDPVPILKNLARGSNKGGDAKQTTALNQPKALPLIKNPSGNLGGYLYIPDVAGNYATGPSVTIGSNETWEGELDMVITQWGSHLTPMGGGYWSNGFGLVFYTSGAVRLFSKASGAATVSSGVTLGTPFNVKYGFDGSAIYVDIDGARVYSDSSSGIVSLQSGSITHTLELNQQANIGNVGNYAIQKAKLTVNNAVVFDCDFNGSTSIRHGDTKFQASVGGPVVLTKAGNDPVTVVKKGVLRFDGVNDGFKGLFDQTINGGYMFAAFSVLGDGGDNYGRVFTVNPTGGNDYSGGGLIFASRQLNEETLRSYFNANQILNHSDIFDDESGDFLVQTKITSGSQSSFVNNANPQTASITGTILSEEFNIGHNEDNSRNGGENAAIDLEFLALFSAATVPDEATATKIRDYINKRNNVFSLVDNSYYFFDPQKASFTGNFTGANTLDGYITGSDNGDTDVRSNLTLEQSTLNDQPSTDGYTITFNDAAEHLEFENAASQNLTGWQVCGTSLGTFVYRVQGAVTELNLLGNAGAVRSIGDLYGIILLPASATGKDIEDARKLLIDRGAADGATVSSYQAAWYLRSDIKEFKSVNMTEVTNVESAWNSSGLISFSTPLPSATNARFAFYNSTQLSDFRTTDIKDGTDFTGCWQNCSSLQSFPAGAKLGTSASASSVNFTDAWRSSGLTSFSTPLPTATNLSNAFLGCSSLESFSTPLPKAEAMGYSWYNCSSLTDFSSDVFTNWNPSSIGSGVFNLTWDGCTSLTAQSVENILTSIDASGHYATTNKVSGGPALADAGIDIDYDGTTLSAATNTAIDSLSGKGWEVYINGVLVIPNILDLAPAAAYSLRSFDADADPNVVNVRRSSDGATSDFKASDVSDGTLTTWVNTEYETVTNGEFATDSVWTKGSGWDIANGKATSDGTQTGLSYLFEASSMGASQNQRVTLVVSDYTAGTVRVRLGNSAPSSSITSHVSSNGTHVFTLPSHSDPSILFIEASADFQGSIESISVVQLTADGHVTTWYDQGGTNHATQATASSQPKIVDGGTLVTEGGLAALNFPTEISNLSLDHSDLYGQATLDSYYVTSTTDTAYIYPSCLTGPNHYGMVAELGSSSTNRSNFYGSPDFYANGSRITGILRNDIHTATSGGQRLVAHIGAYTTDPNWGTSNMDFGNYANNAYFSYTGKLQEMIFFNTDQSANRTGIENNINDHFDIYS